MKLLLIFLLPIILIGNELKLIKEKKIYKILDLKADKKLEASGITCKDKNCYIVFDNKFQIAKISKDLKFATLIGKKGKNSGFEGICFDKKENNFIVITEMLKNGYGKLSFYNQNLKLKDETILKDIKFKDENKGFEGIDIQYKNNKKYLFTLCEGNKCKKSDKVGNGVIHIFKLEKDNYRYFQKLKIPKIADFEDYSGLDIFNDKIAIVSQTTSSLWLSDIKFKNGEWRIKKGIKYTFPKKDNKIIYGNIEGISFLDNDRIVVVSDKAKDNAPKITKKKEQSIHIFTF